MKINTDSQQPVTVQQVARTAKKLEAGAVVKKGAAEKAQRGDTVELSPSLDAELKARDAERARRVEQVKSQVKAGKYKVDTRVVAEKILSGKVGS